MKTNKSSKAKSGLERNALWRDCDDYFDYNDPPDDFREAHELIGMWKAFRLDWARVKPHPFSAGDKVILFSFAETTSGYPEVGVIEVVHIGHSESKDNQRDLSQFIAYRKPEGFTEWRELSLEQVLDLMDKGFVKDFPDLQKPERLSPEEWDEFIKVLNLRE